MIAPTYGTSVEPIRRTYAIHTSAAGRRSRVYRRRPSRQVQFRTALAEQGHH